MEESSIESNIHDELDTILEETILGHVSELERILGRPWSNDDFARTLIRLTNLEIDASSVEEAVNHEVAQLGATDQLADLLHDYFVMLMLSLLVAEGLPGDGYVDVLCHFKFKTRCYNNGAMEGDEECCVCLERLHRGLVATLDCGHEFHRDCIGRWLLRGQDFCPLCKLSHVLLL